MLVSNRSKGFLRSFLKGLPYWSATSKTP